MEITMIWISPATLEVRHLIFYLVQNVLELVSIVLLVLLLI